MTVETFPQDRVTAARPQGLMELIAQGKTPEQMLTLAAAKFPNLLLSDLVAAIRDHCVSLVEQQAQNEREAAFLHEVTELTRPVFHAGEAETLDEALQILADRGNARAADLLQKLDSPEHQEFLRLFEEAVDHDPFWIKEGTKYRVLPGAVHQTPEALVSAYLRNRSDV